MLSQAEATARVQLGAAHLDRVRPGWFNRIDVGTLTLHDPCGCIIGQLCGPGFRLGMRSLGLTGNDILAMGFERTDADFLAWMNAGEPYKATTLYQPLQDAWIAVIAARRFPDRAVCQPEQIASVTA